MQKIDNGLSLWKMTNRRNELMKKQAKETFKIIDGPKHPFNLTICLLDPYPRPQQVFRGYSLGMRHPDFIMDLEGIHDKRENEENQEIIHCLEAYWEEPPIHITGLWRGEKDDNTHTRNDVCIFILTSDR